MLVAAVGGLTATVLTAGPVAAGRAAPTTVTAAGPATGSPAPIVDDDDLARSVRDLAGGNSVRDLPLARAVINLRTQTRSGSTTTVTISSDVLFAFDSATLTPLADQQIDAVAAQLRASSGPVRVDGYTDDVGSGPYNLGLSRRRADAVAARLRAGPRGATAVTATGHGEADPAAPDTDPDGRTRNRRVTVTFGG